MPALMLAELQNSLPEKKAQLQNQSEAHVDLMS
jgi:hypothetical protein